MMAALRQLMLVYFLTCSGKNAHGSNIINGKEVPEGSRLYMVSVQNSEPRHICGGFLISYDFAVTAAHCRNPTSVVVGTRDLKAADAMRYTVKTCKHPNYEDARKGDDIMLLKLDRKAQQNIQEQIIGLSEYEIQENTECSVAGWGFTKSGGEVVDVLHEVDVTVINTAACVNKWKNFGCWLPNNITCAGGFNTKKGFCGGDSGGPLVCNGEAAGVVSFNCNNNCDYPNLPNIYTDVSKYKPWIDEILSQNDC
ncbi:duodenase-1-like [Mugil cephalus]|uniref:duodenase-1-like n=1 Tax=Mugil cephalus TaxID=48193 RepID=UPI001FB6535A|nr:duodenase-1-like [Mugil cephalus]